MMTNLLLSTSSLSTGSSKSVRRFLQTASGVIGVAMCLTVTGCGAVGSPCSVQGTVDFDGKPVADGAIRFSTQDGTTGPGGLSPITDGKYAIPLDKGMRAGKYTVVILGFRDTGKMFKADESSEPVKLKDQYIPARYNSSSTEQVTLDSGENTKDFKLSR